MVILYDLNMDYCLTLVGIRRELLARHAGPHSVYCDWFSFWTKFKPKYRINVATNRTTRGYKRGKRPLMPSFPKSRVLMSQDTGGRECEIFSPQDPSLGGSGPTLSTANTFRVLCLMSRKKCNRRGTWLCRTANIVSHLKFIFLRNVKHLRRKARRRKPSQEQDATRRVGWRIGTICWKKFQVHSYSHPIRQRTVVEIDWVAISCKLYEGCFDDDLTAMLIPKIIEMSLTEM